MSLIADNGTRTRLVRIDPLMKSESPPPVFL